MRLTVIAGENRFTTNTTEERANKVLMDVVNQSTKSLSFDKVFREVHMQCGRAIDDLSGVTILSDGSIEKDMEKDSERCRSMTEAKLTHGDEHFSEKEFKKLITPAMPIECEDEEVEAHVMPLAEYDEDLSQYEGIKGFVYIQCDHCGEITATNIKEPIHHFRCRKCDGYTPLLDLNTIVAKCECGRSYKYLTNLDIEQFDMECMNCGTPMPIIWHEKHQQYESIRE